MDDIFDKVANEVFSEKTSEPTEKVERTVSAEVDVESVPEASAASEAPTATSVPVAPAATSVPVAPSAPKVNMTDLFSGLFKSFLPDEMKNNKDVDKLFDMFLPKQGASTTAATAASSITGDQVENIVSMLFGKETVAHAVPAAPVATPVRITCDTCKKESPECTCVCDNECSDEESDEESEEELEQESDESEKIGCECTEEEDDEDDEDDDEETETEVNEVYEPSFTKGTVFVVTHDDEIKGYTKSYHDAERVITRLHRDFVSQRTTSFLRTKRTVGSLVVYERKMYTLLPFSDEIVAVFSMTMVPKVC